MGDTSHFNGSLDDSAAVELTGKIMVAAIIVLFLVVVFVLFLHLYAKWFWWRVEDPTRPSNHSRRRGRRFVFAPGQQEASAAALRRGLEPSVLRSLPVLVFKPEEYKDGLECAVCLSELVEGEKARMLPNCNHGFHVECIDMWFQSHSTCPLCRNSVGPDSTSNSSSSFEFPDTASPTSTIPSQDDDNNSGVVGVGVIGYSLESPNFPTNVLFWGNQTQVSSGVLCLDEGPSSQPPPSSSSSTTSSTSTSTSSSSSNRPDGMLVIDIPRQTAENFSSCSPSGRYTPDEDQKSPLPTRLRSLKRLLSREKRVIPCSPNSVDVEQGVGTPTSR